MKYQLINLKKKDLILINNLDNDLDVWRKKVNKSF
jgi:hypothetical protein